MLHKNCHQFHLERLYYPEEMKNKGYAKFWGQTSCDTGDVQMANEIEEKREG